MLLHKPTGHHGCCRSIPGTEPPCRPQGTPLLLLLTEGFFGDLLGLSWYPRITKTTAETHVPSSTLGLHG